MPHAVPRLTHNAEAVEHCFADASRSSLDGSLPLLQSGQAETRASNADASMSEIHFTKPTWEKRAAHTMAWVGEKDNDLTSESNEQMRMFHMRQSP